jgi:hypothetical protein
MAYTGGAVTDLKVVRTGPQTFRVEFTVPDDGTGNAARVQVRSANASAGDWWWSKTEEGVSGVLLTTGPGQYTPGQYVIYPANAGRDLDGVRTYFQAVASDFALTGYSVVLPKEPGLLVEFGTWVEPEPEPEPEEEPPEEEPAEEEPEPDPTDPPRDVTLKEGRVELWRPVPWVPTPWGTMALFIGKKLPEEEP